MTIITGLFIIALAGIAAGMVGSIAKALGRRSVPPSEVADLKALIDQNAGDLEETRRELASQSAHLADLEERVDFAERLLAQARERKALDAGR